MMTRVLGAAAWLAAVVLVCSLDGWRAWALDGPDLYAGESALYDTAAKEGLVVSSNTGANWANWGALAQAFAKRYANVTLAYNDIGSGAAVIALDRTRSKPTGDTIYLFGIAGVGAASRGLLAGFKPGNFDKLPAGARDARRRRVPAPQVAGVFIVDQNRF